MEVSNELISACASLAPKRLVSLTDSMVTLGAWAKGRSSSFLLNGILRSTIGWCVSGRKQVNNVKVDAKHNPSDDRSRDVRLRNPVKAKPWMFTVLEPEGTPVADLRSIPRRSRGFLETFAGRAGLSQAVAARGMPVLRPLEAYPRKHVYLRDSDISREEVWMKVLDLIRSGLLFCVHFGVTCST